MHSLGWLVFWKMCQNKIDSAHCDRWNSLPSLSFKISGDLICSKLVEIFLQFH